MSLRVRFPLLAIGMIALVTGVWAGLARLGWPLPMPRVFWPIQHGPLMISGFLGTLIALERAVAWKRPWTYAGPALTAAGALVLLLTGLTPVAGPLFILGSLVVVVIFVQVWQHHPGLPTALMGLAALLWVAGNIVWWRTASPVLATPWWIGFLVLTIAGERLELGRLLFPSPSVRHALIAAVAMVTIGVLLSLSRWTTGMRVMGIGLVALALWLGRFDIAHRTVRRPGLPRFVAIALLSGYIWLAVSGILMMLWDPTTAGWPYDAFWHAIFLGFVMSMVFGHAPIVFPAVLELDMPFSPRMYVPLIILHTSLLMRLLGDLVITPEWRLWGGMGNGVAIALFLLNILYTVRRARR